MITDIYLKELDQEIEYLKAVAEILRGEEK